MTWPITPQVDDALRSLTVRPAVLLELDHPAGFFRMWSGIGTITWGSKLFRGAGALLTAQATEETTEIQVQRIVFTLIAPDFDDEALAIITTPIRRRAVTSWKALLDEGLNVIPEPRLRFSGFADTPSISDSADGQRVIQMTCEGALHNLTTPLQRQVSNEEQIALFPGDSGLGLMSSIPNQQLVWDIGPYNNFAPPP